MFLRVSVADSVIRGQSFQCDQASEPPRQTTQQNRNRATLDR